MRGAICSVLVLMAAAAVLASGCGTSTSASAAVPSPSGSPRAVVTTFAGGRFGYVDGQVSAARLGGATGLGFDANGLLLLTTGATVATVSPDALVTTIAGSQTPRFGYRDGTGPRARFNATVAVACDREGNAYILDVPNDVIRKVTTTGLVTTLAGKANTPGYRDGTGAGARFRNPEGIVFAPDGNLYVTDLPGSVRRVTTAGVVTTIAGAKLSGYADGSGKAARFNQPHGITCDPDGNLYVADTVNAVIRKVTPDVTVTTIAGKPGVAKWRDGSRTTARLKQPFSIARDASGDLFVSDWTDTIRMVRPDGSIVTIAGKPYTNGSANGTGSAARFKEPIMGIACDSQGQVFVAVNAAIRKLVLK